MALHTELKLQDVVEFCGYTDKPETAFASGDVITHAAALGRRPVRIASGYDDPFYPGVRALARALPAGAVAVFGPGCHDGSFFTAQEPPSLAFLASHLA